MKQIILLASIIVLPLNYLFAEKIEELTPKQNIAVNNLSPKGLGHHESLALTDAFRSELAKTGRFQVLERGKMNEILMEQGFEKSGACDESECVVEMGQLLGVNLIAVGNIGRVGKTFTINVRLVDVATGKIVNDVSEYHKGERDELLTETIPVLAKKLAGTYTKSRKGYWIAGSVAVAGAVSGLAYILTRDEEQSETKVKIKW